VSLTVKIAPPSLQKVGCPCIGLEDWLTQEGISPEHASQLLAGLPGGSGAQLLARVAATDVPVGPFFLPNTHSFSSTHIHLAADTTVVHIDDRALKAFLKFIEALEKTPYDVIIQNGTQSDFENLTVIYFRNVLVGSTIQKVGPVAKSLAVLPAGESADFQTTTNCLEMADQYIVQVTVDGSVNNFPQNITDLNKQEEQQFGSVDFCGDSLIIS
jgi:hypothetical protein